MEVYDTYDTLLPSQLLFVIPRATIRLRASLNNLLQQLVLLHALNHSRGLVYHDKLLEI